MKPILCITLVSLVALSVGAAPDAKDAIKSAAKSLAAKDNYSWTSDSHPEGTEEGFRMTSEGKTEKSGLTQVTLTFGDRNIEVAMKGPKVAVKQEDEWKSADELEGRGAGMARRYQNFKAPAAEAQDLVDKAKDLKAGADGLYSGDLPESAIKEMFARFRRAGGQGPEVKDAKGWVKFWVKDGQLTKFEYNTQGKMTMGQDQEERAINQTTTITIKDVGTTKLTVPEEAKKKLS